MFESEYSSNINISEAELKEKERFEELSNKSLKRQRKIMLLVFGLIGIIFLILGLCLLAADVRDEDGFLVGIVFAPMGALFLILGIILFFAMPKQYTYEKFKKRHEKYGIYSWDDVYLMFNMQQAKIETLEKRIEQLENKNKSTF